jgi:small subunit ribosomal protein S8
MQLASTIAIIRFSQKKLFFSCYVPYSSFTESFLQTLFKLGLISGFTRNFNDKIEVFLRYDNRGRGLLNRLKVVSKPGTKKYIKNDNIHFYSSSSSALVSSDIGVLHKSKVSKKTLRDKHGGEIICIF